MAMVTVMLGEQTLGSHSISHYPFVVGRDPACDVHIDNIGVSRQHCQFLWSSGTFQVQDLGSANGTQINGEKVKQGALKDGDEIRLGKYKLMFHQAQGEPAPPPKDQKGKLADLIEEVVEDKPKADVGPGDGIKTFQMSADLIRAQAGVAASVSGSGQRAGDVAKAFESNKAASKKGLMIALVAAGVLVVALVGIIVVLMVGKQTTQAPKQDDTHGATENVAP